MCYYSDLFGDIIVTVNDVNLWLDTIPLLKGCSNSRRNYYAKNNDVSNKIKLSKLNGSFEKLINQVNDEVLNDEKPLECFNTIYVPIVENKAPDCPPYFHVCENHECPVYISRAKHSAHRKIYQARKSSRAAL